MLNFPSISKGQSSTAPDPLGLRTSCGLPMVKITEHPKTTESAVDKGSYTFPDLRSFTSSTAEAKHSRSPHSNIPKGITGLEEIFRTSQDDTVGEYHNVEGKSD